MSSRKGAKISSILLAPINDIHNDIGAGLHAQFGGIQADVEVLGVAPVAAGVVLVIDLAALVLLGQTGGGSLLGLAVELDDAVLAELVIGVDEDVQSIFPVLQDVVGVTANDDAGALVRQLEDDAALDIPQEIIGAQAIHDAGDALGGEGVGEEALAGGMFAVLLHVIGGEAGLDGDLFDQLLVVEGDAQLLGHQTANGAAAAAEFTADGDDLLFHKITSFGAVYLPIL